MAVQLIPYICLAAIVYCIYIAINMLILIRGINEKKKVIRSL